MKNKKNENPDEQDLPGYPHYSPEDDITRTASAVEIDIENLSRNTNVNTIISEAGHPGSVVKEQESSDGSVAESPERQGENDVTEEDLKALGELGMNIDGGDDDLLKNRPYANVAGDSDLDVPGAEDDDFNEAIGSEDEENNYYSLGGDENDLLENDSSRPL